MDARQVEPHGRAVAELGVEPDRAVVLADDAVRGREPEPRARARALGREERLEHARARFLVHAVPVSATDSRTYGPGGSGTCVPG